MPPTNKALNMSNTKGFWHYIANGTGHFVPPTPYQYQDLPKLELGSPAQTPDLSTLEIPTSLILRVNVMGQILDAPQIEARFYKNLRAHKHVNIYGLNTKPPNKTLVTRITLKATGEGQVHFNGKQTALSELKNQHLSLPQKGVTYHKEFAYETCNSAELFYGQDKRMASGSRAQTSKPFLMPYAGIWDEDPEKCHQTYYNISEQYGQQTSIQIFQDLSTFDEIKKHHHPFNAAVAKKAFSLAEDIRLGLFQFTLNLDASKTPCATFFSNSYARVSDNVLDITFHQQQD